MGDYGPEQLFQPLYGSLGKELSCRGDISVLSTYLDCEQLREMKSSTHQRDTWHSVAVPSGPPLLIAMLMFPDMYPLDLFGPYQFLAGLQNAHVYLVSKTLKPVTADKGVMVLPTTTLSDCPRDLDVLFVPGGTGGVNPLLNDDEVLNFVADHGSRARYVTSVCTGALILGAAGLLGGYKAATHWAAMDLLPIFGAIPTAQRVVEDRNRITGGGVTAGIDFGLTIAARLYGADYAKMLQLLMEYDPQPPFRSGSPEGASPKLVAHLDRILKEGHDESGRRAQDAVKRRGLSK